MCYLYSTWDHVMVGWVGDEPRKISPHVFCDADFAGCPYTLRSTSGVHCDLEGPNTRFPWAAGSNQQTSRAQSTPEADFASLNRGMKDRGEPVISLLAVVLHQYHCEKKKCDFIHCARYEPNGGHKTTGSDAKSIDDGEIAEDTNVMMETVAGGGDWLRINFHEDNTTCISKKGTPQDCW